MIVTVNWMNALNRRERLSILWCGLRYSNHIECKRYILQSKCFSMREYVSDIYTRFSCHIWNSGLIKRKTWPSVANLEIILLIKKTLEKKNNLQKLARSVVVVENDVSNVQVNWWFIYDAVGQQSRERSQLACFCFSNFNSPKLDNISQNIVYSFALWIQSLKSQINIRFVFGQPFTRQADKMTNLVLLRRAY